MLSAASAVASRVSESTQRQVREQDHKLRVSGMGYVRVEGGTSGCAEMRC